MKSLSVAFIVGVFIGLTLREILDRQKKVRLALAIILTILGAILFFTPELTPDSSYHFMDASECLVIIGICLFSPNILSGSQVATKIKSTNKMWIPFTHLSQKWDNLKGWQRGILGILLVIFALFAVVLLYVIFFQQH